LNDIDSRIPFTLNGIEDIFVEVRKMLHTSVAAVLTHPTNDPVMHVLAVASFASTIVVCHWIMPQKSNQAVDLAWIM
jgi:hypothetical protein